MSQKIAYIAYQGDEPFTDESAVTWNSLLRDIQYTNEPLIGTVGQSLGWAVTHSDTGHQSGTLEDCTGDAVWVDNADVSSWRHRNTSRNGRNSTVYSGLDDGLTYNLEVFVSQLETNQTSLRVVELDQEVDVPIELKNSTTTVLFENITPVNGVIEMEFRRGPDGSVSNGGMNAARLIENYVGPVFTPTNPPQGGELFQFSGSNYSAQPTGPMTFTQGTRTISRAVTISNWNAEDGSFTGVTDTALPGVPASGASDTPALLYGEPVTISLPDPGA